MKKITITQIKAFLNSDEKINSLLEKMLLLEGYELKSAQYVTHAKEPRVQVEGFILSLLGTQGVVEVIFDSKPKSVIMKVGQNGIDTISQLMTTEQDDVYEIEEFRGGIMYVASEQIMFINNGENNEVETIFLEESNAHQALIQLLTT